MTEQFNVVVAGHICLDVIPNLDHLPGETFSELFQPGHLIMVGPALFCTGGPVSNTGLALHRLGVSTHLMGKVGSDPFGSVVRTLVERFDPVLVQGLVTDPASPTSYSVIVNPPGVDRIFLHCTGANDTFVASDVNLDLVRQATLFHFGYPPIMRRMYTDGGTELTEVFRWAKSTGVTTSLDVSFPDPSSESGKANWKAILQATLPYVDIFGPSFEEILYMLRRDTYEEMRKVAPGGDVLALLSPGLLGDLSSEMMEMGARMVLIKLGDRGVYLRSAGVSRLAEMGPAAPRDLPGWADQELWAPCFQVNVVGTTGSGDATIAGFLSGLLRGFSPRQAVTAAVAVGACNVEAADALSGIRSWEETMARISSGWNRLSLALEDPSWAWDSAGEVWAKQN
ncbi:MAG: carbohydrate kinase family protein [Anaerolineaceae bacterium]|nr:carbohydrate kinase family protein [Anaerolineaceae bacterium]